MQIASMQRISVCALIVWLVAVAPQLVLAAAKDPPAYTEAIELGVSEFEAGNATEARAHFTRAHALYPNARTLRALGMVAFELKRYLECTRYLEQALGSTERTLEGERRKETEKLLERANGYLGRFILDLESDTRLTVDGGGDALRGGDELVLEAGDHTLEFRASGRVANKRVLTVQGGEREPLRVVLVPLQLGSSGTHAHPPGGGQDSSKKRPLYRNPWLWTAVGLVLAGAGAGAAIAITRDPTTKNEAPYSGTGGAPPLGAP